MWWGMVRAICSTLASAYDLPNAEPHVFTNLTPDTESIARAYASADSQPDPVAIFGPD